MKTTHAMTVVCAAAFLLAASTGPARSQSAYPSQQIKIICPFPAGGGTDLTARLLGEQLSNVPAIAEYPPLAGFELVNFFGFFGPAGLPDPLLRRLNAAAVQALKTPDMAQKLQNAGFEPAPTTPEQFREFIKGESAKFAKIIVEAGIKLE